MRLIALLLLVVLSAALTEPARAAERPVDCIWNGFSYDCTTQVSAGGAAGSSTPADPDTSVSEAGTLTAGPTTCEVDGATVPCATDDGAFVQSDLCTGYVRLADAQPAPPPGEVAGSGAWYSCTFPCTAVEGADPVCDLTGVGGVDYWSETPPPGVERYTPAQAAAVLARTFRLEPIRIGMAPARKVHDDDPPGTAAYRRTWVGIPVWLWVADPTPLTYGPYEQTATLGGVTVTARASVTRIQWRSGDGQQTTCGVGTVFDPQAWVDRAAEPSPTCGIEFQHTSASAPGGSWTVSAASRWQVEWSGGGENGVIDLTDLAATTPVVVRELQSVNVPITSRLIGGR